MASGGGGGSASSNSSHQTAPKILLAKPPALVTRPVGGGASAGAPEDDSSAATRSRLPSIGSLNLLSDSWDFNPDKFLPVTNSTLPFCFCVAVSSLLINFLHFVSFGIWFLAVSDWQYWFHGGGGNWSARSWQVHNHERNLWLWSYLTWYYA